MKYYTLKEISKHNHENDCWLVADSYVYDVTKFIDIHPGSKNAILRHAGKICNIDYNFHSSNAKKIWNKYKIGKFKKKYKNNNSFCIIS